MSKMEDVAATAGGDRDRRRSPRLIRAKELSACASEQDLILKLKEEAKALRALRVERIAREGLLDDYVAAWQAASEKDRKAVKVPPPAGALKDRKAAEVPQPAGAGKKRKKVVKSRVPEELIGYMILNRRKPYEGICEEYEVGKRPQRFRELYAEQVAISNKRLEYEDALIKQFRSKGYAEDYTEVTDSEDEN